VSTSRATIPPSVREWADAAIARFNETTIRDPDRYYVGRYRGRFLYLDRLSYGIRSQVSRLTYTGDKEQWDFAIYKYSDEAYDPEEWLFPGSEHVNGTIEGAMRAGLEAYP
jgi:hypothetical protein